MTSQVFKKTIFISLLGHITVFSIFSFSFGNRIPKIDYACVSFLGSILRSSDLSKPPFSPHLHTKVRLNKKADTSVLNKVSEGYALVLQEYFKPSLSSSFNEEKLVFTPKAKTISFVQKRKEPTIMFYPHLPYHFLLYFKDRQAVHIELMFNIISTGRTNTIAIKRKISSGNLEVDLLSMRYISHYLFIQQARFTPNSWQTVKIDLSTGND